MNKKRIEELDCLRGIAALLVVLLHFNMDSAYMMQLGFRVGATGVDLFFMISGFVILMTLEKTRDWKDFVVSRFSRLYPAFWACAITTTLFAAVWFATGGQPYFQTHLYASNIWIQLLGNMTMFQHYLRVQEVDDVYWTLTVELVFYIFMLGVFVFRQLKNIELIGALLLVPVALYGFFVKDHFESIHRLLNYVAPLINHWPVFLAGIVLYKLRFDKVTWQRYALLALCLIIQPLLFDDGGKSKVFVTQMEYNLMLVLYFVIFLLYIHDRLRWVVNPVTLYLGSISYVLYLIHQVVGIMIVTPWLVSWFGLNYWVATFGIALPFIFVLASLIHFYVEKPSMEWIRGRWKAMRA